MQKGNGDKVGRTLQVGLASSLQWDLNPTPGGGTCIPAGIRREKFESMEIADSDESDETIFKLYQTELPSCDERDSNPRP